MLEVTMEELEELKEQVGLLTKKVEILEKKENKRKALIYAKILIKVIVILSIVYGCYRGYDYVVNEIPHIMEEKIKELNPLKKYN